MLHSLIMLSPEPPHQNADDLGVMVSVNLNPKNDFHFMQIALWQKLTLGCRLSNWQPACTSCPLDGEQETMAHAVTTCKFL